MKLNEISKLYRVYYNDHNDSYINTYTVSNVTSYTVTLLNNGIKEYIDTMDIGTVYFIRPTDAINSMITLEDTRLSIKLAEIKILNDRLDGLMDLLGTALQ